MERRKERGRRVNKINGWTNKLQEDGTERNAKRQSARFKGLVGGIWSSRRDICDHSLELMRCKQSRQAGRQGPLKMEWK